MNPSPLVCPRPGPHNPGPDCPLWDARERIALQRSIEADGTAQPSMGELVWIEMNKGFSRPESPPTRPVPIEARPIAALIADEAMTTETTNEKGEPVHV